MILFVYNEYVYLNAIVAERPFKTSLNSAAIFWDIAQYLVICRPLVSCSAEFRH
jgi:hypothetical protein